MPHNLVKEINSQEYELSAMPYNHGYEALSWGKLKENPIKDNVIPEVNMK